MVLRFCDGFDIYEDTGDMEDGGFANSGKTYSASGGRFGGGCVVGTDSTYSLYVATPASQLDTLTICFAYKHDGNGGSTDDLLTVVASNNGVIGRIRHDTAGNVTGYGNLIGSPFSGSGALISPNEWHWIEFQILCGTNASNDGAIIIRVDETEVVNETGIDTAITSLDVAGVYFYGGNGTHYIDDIIIIDDSTSATDTTTDFLGDVRIDTLRPTANGTHQDWTANTGAAYAAIDDPLATSDGDTTYVTSSVMDEKSTFVIEDAPGIATAVIAAQVRARARKGDAGSRSIGAVAKNVSTTEELTTGADPGETYNWARAGFFTEDPATSAQFTPSGFNSCEFGFKLIN